MTRLVVGSFNKKKRAEMLDLLAGLPLEVVSLAGFDGIEEEEETGDTFEENAAQKAAGFSRQTGELVVADDSGIVVDALDGRPGVYSARYGGPGLTEAEQRELLLREMANVPDGARTARFVCAVAMARGDEIAIRVSGAVEGRIVRAAAGDAGFGYDPVFAPNGYDRTFGELGAEVKRRISHRARALRRFRQALADWLTGARRAS